MFHLVMRTENTFNKHDHIIRVLFNEFYDSSCQSCWQQHEIANISKENGSRIAKDMTLNTRRRIEVIKNLPVKREPTHDFCVYLYYK